MSNSNKTPAEDFTRFEHFIDGMSDTEFDMWYDYEASNKQKDLADTIREEVEEEEAQEHLTPKQSRFREFLKRFFKR